MKHELTPTQLALLRRASIECVGAEQAIGAASVHDELSAMSLAGLLGRQGGNAYRITTMGVLLLEELDMMPERR